MLVYDSHRNPAEVMMKAGGVFDITPYPLISVNERIFQFISLVWSTLDRFEHDLYVPDVSCVRGDLCNSCLTCLSDGNTSHYNAFGTSGYSSR